MTVAPSPRASSTVPSLLKESTTKIWSATRRALDSVAPSVSSELNDKRITVGRITTMVAHERAGSLIQPQPDPATIRKRASSMPGDEARSPMKVLLVGNYPFDGS